MRADHFVDDVDRLIDRNRKGDLLRADTHRHVHADDLAVDVQQRSAGVTGVDARAGLDQVAVLLRVVDRHVAVQRGDDPFGRRMDIAKGIADRDHRFTDHQIAAGAARDHLQRFVGLHLEQRQVAADVGGDHVRGRAGAVGQCDPHFFDVFDDVIVGDHIATRIDHDAGAHPVDLPRRFGAGHGRGRRSHGLLPVNVHHRVAAAANRQHHRGFAAVNPPHIVGLGRRGKLRGGDTTGNQR